MRIFLNLLLFLATLMAIYSLGSDVWEAYVTFFVVALGARIYYGRRTGR